MEYIWTLLHNLLICHITGAIWSISLNLFIKKITTLCSRSFIQSIIESGSFCAKKSELSICLGSTVYLEVFSINRISIFNKRKTTTPIKFFNTIWFRKFYVFNWQGRVGYIRAQRYNIPSVAESNYNCFYPVKKWAIE